MKFSIIVPVYNVEKYLEKCVKSILNQNFNNYEIILIDDGSTDNSGKICDQYANLDSKIKVYHKKNGGLSEARNYGIDKAQGEYLLFVDSDDWIEPHSLSEFYKIIKDKKIDVIETGLTEVYDGKSFYYDDGLKDFFKNEISKEKAIDWILKKTHNTWPAPKRIYSKKFIDDNNLKFINGFFHEDIDWTSNFIYCAENYEICTYHWYNHRMNRVGSITNNIKYKNIMDVLTIAKIHYDKFNLDSSFIHKKVMDRIMISVYSILKNIHNCNKLEQEKIIEFIKKNKKMFKIAPKIKYKIFSIFLRFFGVRFSMLLFTICS